MNKENYTLIMDLYELTMANAYFKEGKKDDVVYFDMFFRKTPDRGSFSIAAGLSQLIEYIENFNIEEEQIEYLRTLNLFDEEFLKYLKNLKFTGDIWAVEEGTPVFPKEPIVRVRANIIEAILIETMLLLSINHQTLIATKASRIVRAAKNVPVVEFGARRAQGKDAAIYGSRASYIGGCIGTSNVFAGNKFGIPVIGTMSHSWIQIFNDEYKAFKIYAENYPNSTVLLVDTYDTLKSGIPNAIKVFDEVLKPNGYKPVGIRIDSGDLAYLSKQARKMLDDAGYDYVKIVASNSIDENILKDLRDQDACIDMYGVGERLITAKSDATFGGVYKLVAVEEKGKIVNKIKISDNPEKITIPGVKELYRFYDKTTKKALADVITLYDEKIDETKPYELFDPIHTWKQTAIINYEVKKLLVKIFENGKCIYKNKTIDEIIKNKNEELSRFWDGVKRIRNPHRYFVDMSKKLWDMKHELLNRYSVRGKINE